MEITKEDIRVATGSYPIEQAMLEALAELYHVQWSGWTQWFFEHLDDEHIARWKRQMTTPYAELSETEKDSDRKEAVKAFKVLGIHVPRTDTVLCWCDDQEEHYG